MLDNRNCGALILLTFNIVQQPDELVVKSAMMESVGTWALALLNASISISAEKLNLMELLVFCFLKYQVLFLFVLSEIEGMLCII